MICGSPRQHRTLARVRGRGSRGFTLLELVLVIAVGMILAAMAVPVIWNTMRIYSMRSAISSLTGAISSSRYQAIFHGCKSQVVFTQSYLQLSGTKRSPGVRRTSMRRCLHERGRSGAADGTRRGAQRRYHVDFQPGWQRRRQPGRGTYHFNPELPGLPRYGAHRNDYGVYLWKHHSRSVSRARSAASLSSKPWWRFSSSPLAWSAPPLS